MERSIDMAAIFLNDGCTDSIIKNGLEAKCYCNGNRRLCTSECRHDPNYRKECTPTCGQSCTESQISNSVQFLQIEPKRNPLNPLEKSGVTALEDAEPNQIIALYRGVARTTHKYQDLWVKKDYGRIFFVEYFKGLILDGKMFEKDIKYARHDCTPNCDAQIRYLRNQENMVTPFVAIVASKKIKRGDELTLTYNVNNEPNLPTMICTCTRPTCPDTSATPSPD